MLDIRATVKTDADRRLLRFSAKIPGAASEGLRDAAEGTFRIAAELLSGPGSKKCRKKKASGSTPGSYPVPVLSGHLRRMLGFVPPGETKASNGISFTARSNEAIVYDAARYAEVVHEGKRSSEKYGKRRFIVDAFLRFGGVGSVEESVMREIDNER